MMFDALETWYDVHPEASFGEIEEEARQLRRKMMDTLLDALTEREKQVLRMVAQGMSSIQIAEELELSPKTISRHRERIMGKLNLHSAADLVRFAVRVGLVTP